MKSQKGFTLIELLVVATIIVVLSMIGIVSYTNSGRSARDSRRKADIETVRQAMVLRQAENSGYITSGGTQTSANYATLASGLATGGYLSQPTPIDPMNDTTYFYSATSTTSTFCLCARMETNKGNKTSRTCTGTFGATGSYYCVANP